MNQKKDKKPATQVSGTSVEPLEKKLPVEQGYLMPAEWERHEATWLSWPHNKITWPGRVKEVERLYIQLIELIASGEKVNLLISNEGVRLAVLALLGRRTRRLVKRIYFHVVPTVDAWIRDYGPIFVRNPGNVAMTHWIFNGWGKEEEMKADTAVPARIGEILKAKIFEVGMVLEGGSVDVNGKGTCLVTEQCLLNKNRNPGFDKAEIEKYLKDYLGVRHFIWLKGGIAGDDTDGHVDNVARFTAPDTIVCALEEDKKDVNYGVLLENRERLKSLTDQDGKRIRVVTLPMPGRSGDQKTRLPASYLNFYIANSSVLVPIFGVPNDRKALSLLQKLFEDRPVVGLLSEPLLWGLGGIHCITQQEPALLPVKVAPSKSPAVLSAFAEDPGLPLGCPPKSTADSSGRIRQCFVAKM